MPFVSKLSDSVAGELPLDEVLAPNLRNRFYDQHPLGTRFESKREAGDSHTSRAVKVARRITVRALLCAAASVSGRDVRTEPTRVRCSEFQAGHSFERGLTHLTAAVTR